MQLLIMLQISKGHFPLNLPPVPVKVASKSILVMLLHLNILKHPSVTDPVKPDPVDFFPSPSQNLASPVPDKIFNFSQVSLWLLQCDFYIPSIYHNSCVCLTAANQGPDRKG